MKMKLELLCKVKNYIKYKTPWRYVTYNRRLYKGDDMYIDFSWSRERHCSLGFYYDGNLHTDVFTNNEEWFVNILYINFIFATIKNGHILSAFIREKDLFHILLVQPTGDDYIIVEVRTI